VATAFRRLTLLSFTILSYGIIMAAIKAVTRCMERNIAPLRLAEKWDNVRSTPAMRANILTASITGRVVARSVGIIRILHRSGLPNHNLRITCAKAKREPNIVDDRVRFHMGVS
jgi:hypothetical protein